MKRASCCFTAFALAVAWVGCSQPNPGRSPDIRAAPAASVLTSPAADLAARPRPTLTWVSAPARATATELAVAPVDSGLRLQDPCDDVAYSAAIAATFTAGALEAPFVVPQPWSSPRRVPVHVRVVVLPPLNAETAAHLADALNHRVLRDQHEATHIVVKDAAGNVLASRENPFVAGSSPDPGAAKVLTLYSAYAVDAAGHIASGGNAEAKAADGAEPIGTVEVSNTCTNQNVRVALEGLAAYLDSIN